MQVDLTFGEYLRRLRRDKRLPLQDVARRSGLSTTHLSRLENDNGLPTTDTVVKLHRVLGGDLPVMLELSRCLPEEILDRYIRHADDQAPVLKRSALGQADDPVFAKAFVEDMEPVIRRFDPTWLLLSAGFDAHRRDPITGLGLSSGDFASLTARLVTLVPAGRVIAFLEGGYDLEALADSTAAAVGALAGADVRPEAATNGGPGAAVVAAANHLWAPVVDP